MIISKFPIYKKECEKVSDEYYLGIIEKCVNNNILAQVVLKLDDPKYAAIAKVLTKSSEWYITRICNLATINREYQALLSVDTLKLSDYILNSGEVVMERHLNNHGEYFHIPKRLDLKLKYFFNNSQIDALKSSIKKRGVTLIQGPPGTGKTTTILGIISVILNSLLKKEGAWRKDSIINSISQETYYKESSYQNMNGDSIKQNPWLLNSYNNWMDEPIPLDDRFVEYPTSKQTDSFKLLSKPLDDDVSPPEKILVCAPSNVAIDEIVRKIMAVGLIDSDGESYHPKFIRVGPNYHPSVREVSLDYLVSQRLGKDESAKDFEKVKNEILSNVKIVCATLSMAGSNILTSLNQKFDTVLIDEAAQAVEISTLIPLKYMCERFILVGDPKQLSATVFSRNALKHGYDQSLFKRFQEAGHEVTVLRTQYRMNSIISKFISDTFYDSLLEDDVSVKTKTTEGKHLSHPCFQPFTYYDIESEETFYNSSYYNEFQVLIIAQLIDKLQSIYSKEEIIEKLAIISPYSLQVLKIKEALRYLGFAELEVNTVDGFQGREKDMIIFSTVRSKGSRTIGFLSEERRMNVGLSRAKSSLIVIGDSKKLIKDDKWDKLVRYSFRNGTFYKVKGQIKSYFTNFDKKYKDYLVNNEETFVKMIYN